TRQMFLGAMSLFALGTLICGVAPVFEVLLVGRIIQAMGAGFLFPITMNMVLLLYPPYERGKAMGMVSLVIMFAPALGPTLSGIIIDQLTWRWLFLIVLPFVIFSIVFASFHLKNVSEITKPAFDTLSIILSTIGFGGLVFGFGSLGNAGWSNPTVYVSLVVSVISLIWFIIRQIRIDNPMLEMRVFKYPMFSI